MFKSSGDVTYLSENLYIPTMQVYTFNLPLIMLMVNNN